jgi:hypothetical protein
MKIFKLVTSIFILIVLVFVVITSLERVPEVTSFEECIAAGNVVMESYPRQCHANGETFVEYIDTTGDACVTDADCKTPMEYMIQSNCPYGSACIDSTCAVVCPLFSHDIDPEVSKSYPNACEIDSDCDCSERQERSLECRCVNGGCLSVEKR